MQLCGSSVALLITILFLPAGRADTPQPQPTSVVHAPGDEACAGCHRAIYEHYEESPVARASGDRLTCTTCHDPHRRQTTATAAERIAYYRSKCLDCHAGRAFAATHHPEQQNCAACHMPRDCRRRATVRRWAMMPDNAGDAG